MVGIVPIFVVLACALVASITDVSKFKVYNVLTFPCFISGLVYGLCSAGWNGLWLALFGALLGLTILLIPYLMGGLGAGDVKFVMAIGTWIGPTLLIPAILIGCFATICYFFLFIGRSQGCAASCRACTCCRCASRYSARIWRVPMPMNRCRIFRISPTRMVA